MVRVPRMGWFGSATLFVMTLDGSSLHGILNSYADFAHRMHCDKDNTAHVLNSKQTRTITKIESLQNEILKQLNSVKDKYTWLLIVDNIAKLNQIHSLLPQLEDENWEGGQVLITTRDISRVPSNSSLTVHISLNEGMDPIESSELLTTISGLGENEDLVSKVAKKLDYQPLGLASAGFYLRQDSCKP